MFFPKLRPTALFLSLTFSLALAVLTDVNPRLQAEDRSPPETTVDFTRDVQPLLAENCYVCHGPDAETRQADLRLDLESSAKESVIAPGNGSESELIRRIRSREEDELMPPPDSGKSLSDADRDLIERWIDQGAEWQKHWAFVPPRRFDPPAIDDPWINNPIDQFVLARMREHNLQPSQRADAATLNRRLHLDLLGLPPTAGPSERPSLESGSLSRLVDELLDSPHFGERLAVDWLDIARYADTNGYQNDFFRSMWPWRDWVIKSFNENLPYHEFIVAQVAGDMLENPTEEQVIATGFSRNHRMVTEGGSIEAEWHVENVVDRVETTAAAFLGLTVGCARCHDHKYDPISQKDFYRLFAFFNNVDEKGVYIERRGNVPPLVELPSEEQAVQLAEISDRMDRLQQEIKAADTQAEETIAKWRDEKEAPRIAPPVLSLELPELTVASRVPALPVIRRTAATFAGGSPQFQDGVGEPSIALDGTENSHVVITHPSKVAKDTSSSWSFWVKPHSPGAVLSKMDDASDYRGFDSLILPDFRLKIHLVHRWPDDAIAVITRRSLPRDTWSHVVVTYDGNAKARGVKVYFDGAVADTTTERDSLKGSIATDQPLRLGRRSSGNYLKGNVSRFRMYLRRLSADDVADDLRRSLLDATVDGNREAVLDVAGRFAARDLQRQLADVEKERANLVKQVQTTMVMKERDGYRPTYRLERGQYDLPDESEELWPAIPANLPQLKDEQPPNRLGLARWLIDSDNPLVARVVVNQVWNRLMGRELFSAENTGTQGTPPTHPELLDWLAVWLIESGWDFKALHKLIVSSATYQQSSAYSDQLLAADPENRFYARATRYRLPAETIRDSALAISGLLNRRIGGPSVKPYQPDGLWMELAGGANDGPYKADEGDGLYRRSLYTYRKRTVSHPTMSTFDAPSWEICQVKRARTNTPLQSLALLNDITYVEAARSLAARVVESCPGDNPMQIQRAFERATSRAATPSETNQLSKTFAEYERHYLANLNEAEALLQVGASPAPSTDSPAHLAAMTLTSLVILNLDETITRE